jgi:formylglycine-generating enzyme required for sulfatase activity
VVFTHGPVPVSFTDTDVSPYGVLHMAGNVSEWIDVEPEDPDEPGPRTSFRTVRGASFMDNRESGESFARTWAEGLTMERGLSSPSVGFRVARDAAGGGDRRGGK